MASGVSKAEPVAPFDDDFDWLGQAKDDFLMELSPDKSGVFPAPSESTRQPTLIDRRGEATEALSIELDVTKQEQPVANSPQSLPSEEVVEDADLLSFSIDWEIDTRQKMPEKLCQEIQSAVDAVADRLATGATDADPDAPPHDKADEVDDDECCNEDDATDDTSHSLVVILEIVIGEGRTETLPVHVGDDAAALAAEFAGMHGLDPSVVPTLIDHIDAQVRGAVAPLPPSHASAAPPPPAPTAIESTPPAITRRRSSEKELQYNTLRGKFGTKASASSRSLASKASHQPTQASLAKHPTHVKAKSSRRPPSDASAHATAAACERLYALAQAQREWRQRAQKKKDDEVTKELDGKKLRLAEKTKQLVANRTNGQYRTIGDRLYHEAMSESARKKKLADGREIDVDKEWMCPKCAFVNRYMDEMCQNPITKQPKGIVTPASTPRRHSASILALPEEPAPTGVTKSTQGTTKQSPRHVCGQPKPALFQPTRLSKGSHRPTPDDLLVLRRQKHQQVAKAEYLARHPFHPQVNPNSTELVKELKKKQKRTDDDAIATTPTRAACHVALYADASQRRARRQQQEADYLAQFPFSPNIGINAFVATDATPDALFYRLAIQDQAALEETRAKLTAKYGAAKDPDTGRAYFKPDVGRAPQFPRNDTNLPIGDFLYESRRDFEQLHRQRHQLHMDALRDDRTQSFVSKKSAAHLKERKLRSFDTIYTMLQAACAKPSGDCTNNVDNDDDGAILNPAQLDMESLSLELGHVALSLFETCGWVPIPRENFYTCMDATLTHCRHLTHTQVLFFSRDPKPQMTTAEKAAADDERELTLRPKINTSTTHTTRAPGVFDAMYKYHETYATRRKQREAQLRKDEAKVCTFKPATNKGKVFQDLYATIPGDDDDDDDHVMLSTAPMCPRPYVRPIGDTDTEAGKT
ncbi:Aste57867_11503 [Aphanomyces stellatus]|uniref:Aste57867_11503 protein n=1 Tax=Aphanomyces stellatus TaxID=120398 RepID=A0A485KT65_9STRA|nr:hypothetical protein As57867_011460 [Aphanomyces stellatus]VFT88364.1 Aste57867_11503 [Aphanomyces stellatus]